MLALLHDTADAVAAALAASGDRGLSGGRRGQYRSDLTADAAALAVLDGAGVGVLSEESGFRPATDDDLGVVVVVDPLDGSTNADRGVPWCATSLCAVDADGPLAAVVADLPRGVRFEAVRGGERGATASRSHRAGARRWATPSWGCPGWPPSHLGWDQYRALGAAALDLCAVASGVLDAYVDCSHRRPRAVGLPGRAPGVP